MYKRPAGFVVLRATSQRCEDAGLALGGSRVGFDLLGKALRNPRDCNVAVLSLKLSYRLHRPSSKHDRPATESPCFCRASRSALKASQFKAGRGEPTRGTMKAPLGLQMTRKSPSLFEE